MSARPAKLADLDHRKGKLVAGYDADVIIWDPESEFDVVPEIIEHRHTLTPYSGLKLYGKTEAAYISGRSVFDGSFSRRPTGDLLC